MRRYDWVGCGVVCLLLAGSARAAETEARDFAILIDGKRAGDYQMVLIKQDDGSLVMGADANVRVSYLIKTYTYRYHGTEVWKDGRLQRLDSTSNDDGKAFRVTAAPNGSPQVQDSITLKNTGSSDLGSLHLATLNSSTRVTVIPSMSPPLLNPTSLTLLNGLIDLTRNPFVAIPPGRNFTLTVAYALPAKFYTVSGGSVRVDLPPTPPIAAPVDSFSLSMSLPNGLRATQAQSRVVQNATPITSGEQTFAYSLTLGWASDRAIPAASVIFVAALVAFFISVERQEGEEAEGEEKEGGRITGDIPAMIKAFEEKVDLVNTMLREVPKEDPNNLNKAYFVDLRSRVDTFRSRALQRLNDAKQRSTGQRFSEQLTRIHDVEREVDRATRDILNLYEQYYTRRMRQETFEKLLPSYRKRLEGALNRLSDQLNLTQREAKML